MASTKPARPNRRQHISLSRADIVYYPVPRFVRIGRLEGPQRYVKPEHPHGEYEWLYVRKGKFRVWIDGSPLEVGPSDLYFIQPGQTHREESLDEPLDFFALRFTLHDLSGKVIMLAPPKGEMTQQHIRRAGRPFSSLFDAIYAEVYQQKPGAEQVVEAIILQLVWQARRSLGLLPERARGRQTPERQRHLVEQAQQTIFANLNRSLSLAELGRACCASPEYLRHVFKDVTGQSPHQYATELKMKEAQRLMADPSLAIYEIAEQIGFNDPYHFSRQFKKATGVSPRTFRERSRG